MRVLPQNWGSKGQNPWVVLYGTNWHAVGVSKTWNPGPQIVLVLLHLLPNMWVCLKIRYPSVSSNSPLHEHQIAIFWEHPIFSGRKSQFVQIAWHCGCLVSSDGFNIFQICVMSRKFQYNMLIMLLVDSFYMFLLFMLRVCFKSILMISWYPSRDFHVYWMSWLHHQAREIQYFGTPNTHHFTWVDIESKKWPWPKEHIGSCTYPLMPPSSLTLRNAVCTLRRGRTFVWTTSCQLRLPGSEEQIGTVRSVSRFCHDLGHVVALDGSTLVDMTIWLWLCPNRDSNTTA